MVFQELLAVNDLYRLGYELFYWRTTNGREVDFVLYGESGLIAIEVKRAASIRTRELRGLKAFAADYPGTSLYMFCGGEREMVLGGIQLISIDKALTQLPTLLSLK